MYELSVKLKQSDDYYGLHSMIISSTIYRPLMRERRFTLDTFVYKQCLLNTKCTYDFVSLYKEQNLIYVRYIYILIYNVYYNIHV